MWDFIKSVVPRVVQDLLTSAAAWLALHGYLSTDQEQSFIGAAFFLVMLVVNYLIKEQRKTAAAVAGGEAVAVVATDDFSKADVRQIVKTGVK